MVSYKNHDNAKYGTKDFPVKYNRVDCSDTESIIPVHWHKEWEIIRVVKGTFNIQIDSIEYILHEGDIALIKGASLHLYAPKYCIYDFLVFDVNELFRTNELIKKHLRPFLRMEIIPDPIYKNNEHTELSQLIDKLMDSASKYDPLISDYNELTIMAYICCFFAKILEKNLYIKNPDKINTSSDKIGQIKRSIEYIENHYSEAIALTDIARVAGMSPKYFCKIFKEVTHQTPMDYVILYRIEQACIMLSTTGAAIIDIAMECGFNDCSYFIRTFKKLKGKTPSQYRNS